MANGDGDDNDDDDDGNVVVVDGGKKRTTTAYDNSDDTDDDVGIADVCLIEVGGIVGDIELSVYLEALQQFQFCVGPTNFCLTFVSLVPIMGDEQKTKPTQHGVRDLRSVGLSPSVIFCRCREVLEYGTKVKISSFCHVDGPDCVLSVHDVGNVYHVPLLLLEQKLHRILAGKLHLDGMVSLRDRLDLTMDGVEGVSASWNLLESGISGGENVRRESLKFEHCKQTTYLTTRVVGK